MKKILKTLLTSFIAFIIPFSYVVSKEFESTVPSENELYFIGDKILSPSDCYEIVEELGEGAFGKVYAVENSEGQIFALKCYKHEPRFDSEYYTDAEREFTRGQLLDHPNIIKSYDLFTFATHNGLPTKNLILQFVNGQTLSATQKTSLEREKGISALMQLNSALDYAFSLGYMNLDLHSGNLMVTDLSGIMVIDLASFYSLEEIRDFIKETSSYSQSSSYYSVTQKIKETTFHKRNAAVDVTKPAFSLQKKRIEGEKKLRQFFLFNPDLFNKLQQIEIRLGKSDQRKCSTNLSSYSNTDLELFFAIVKNYMDHNYFNRITDTCIRILEKTSISRDERINFRVELKKLAWNYLEDLEEGRFIAIETYFDKLSDFLTSDN